jgi:hypothetical protein
MVRSDRHLVTVVLNGRAERFLIHALRQLVQEFPRFTGANLNEMRKHLRGRLPPQRVELVLGDLVMLLSEMYQAAGALPTFERLETKRASRDELLLVSMIGSAACNDKGRAIEAAITLLDTGYVGNVVQAAHTVGRRLAEVGLSLMPVGRTAFDYFAGYRHAESFGVPPSARPAVSRGPVLYLVKGA